MPRQVLHIFAVNTELEGRHTYLSRSKDEGMDLPNLSGWLGLPQGALNTNEIELFPVSDLADMHLSDYVTTAFDLDEEPSGQALSRMNALEGHVLLVPELALTGTIATTPELTLIASLPIANADHSADRLDTDSVVKEEVEEALEGVIEAASDKISSLLTWLIIAAVVCLIALGVILAF